MPKTVALIRRGFTGPHGPTQFYWKQAIVSGERFPEVAFHDPSYAEFVSILKSRGYQVTDDVKVQDYTTDALIHGCSTISEVLRAEADQLSIKSTIA